jgi:hypothetical protein
MEKQQQYTNKSDKNAPTGLTAAQPAVTPRPANTPKSYIWFFINGPGQEHCSQCSSCSSKICCDKMVATLKALSPEMAN